ncbi:MAG: hypothetical protein ABIM89_11205 [Mycobacteriales bacterium]
MMDLANGWCTACVGVVDFEQPRCGDHDEDCPELICCLCGAAYVGGEVAYGVDAISTTPTRAAVTPAA